MISDLWRVEPGAAADLAGRDPGSTPGAPGGKKDTESTFPALFDRLDELQERLWAEHRQSLLVVLQAMDAGGKDGTVKHVFRGMNPAGVRVTSFKEPSEEERSHDFLWRVHRRTPAAGELRVFNRSHYEDVLVVRVHGLVPEQVWRPRYGFINRFEESLAVAGTRIVKVFLHISREEQARRLRARLEDPTKHWKFQRSDVAERALWTDYQVAYAEAIERTSTSYAPWCVVPADHKWYRNWAVSHILLETLEDMDPRFPPGDDIEGIVIT